MLKNLEKVLKERYNFKGSLEGIQFSDQTDESFPQLTEVLANSAGPVSAMPDPTVAGDNTPKIGDPAFVYWLGYGWFTATIVNWMPANLNYMIIKWTDGNWAAEAASYQNLCVNKVPDPSTIGVGTKVLFKQGLYYCGYDDNGQMCDSTGRGLSEATIQRLTEKKQISDRWHMGRITSVTKKENGETVYNGRHVDPSDPQVSSSNYVGYTQTFEGLLLSELRTLPNVFNCVDSSPTGSNSSSTSQKKCDVFVSKVHEDNEAVRKIVSEVSGKYDVAESSDSSTADVIQEIVGQIKSCSVYLVCLSDKFIENAQAMSELLYAKKTLGKTVIPVVIGKSQNWLSTTAGMLLAGQLYIQFGSEDVFQEKSMELQNNLKEYISELSGPGEESPESSSNLPPRVFLSYCWSNSKLSFEAGQLRSYVGHEHSDPRKIKADIEKRIGEEVWLDIEQLNSTDDSGMFGQIADGLRDSSVVLICVSKEYTNSGNCQMEANFALRSLRKTALILEVGSGRPEDRSAWMRSSVGMVLPPGEKPYLFTADDHGEYEETIDQICRKLKETVLSEPRAITENRNKSATAKGKMVKGPQSNETKSSLRASVPMVGDAVVAHYAAWQFFPAKVANFDRVSMKYTVDWDDPDPSCRVQPYHLVAVNVTATDDMVGIGSSILFKQGTYRFGNSTGDVWNLGEITDIIEEDGVKYYSGKHSKTAADGLAVATWPSYSPTFHRARCQDLRLFPNAIEMLQAYRNEE